MSRIHLRSNTVVLWLSLSAAVVVSALGVGCSSSSDSDPGASAGKPGGGGASAGAGAKAGSGDSEAGEAAAPGETGEGGSQETPAGGRNSGGGSPAAAAGSGGGGVGIGDAGEPAEGGAAGSGVVEDPALVAAQAHALALIAAIPVEQEKCWSCHQANYQGSGFYPNITPDVDNGIGTWTLDEIKTAIREGKDKDHEPLCNTMKRYTEFSDDELTDIAIYLQHLPPQTKKITAKCPSL